MALRKKSNIFLYASRMMLEGWAQLFWNKEGSRRWLGWFNSFELIWIPVLWALPKLHMTKIYFFWTLPGCNQWWHMWEASHYSPEPVIANVEEDGDAEDEKQTPLLKWDDANLIATSFTTSCQHHISYWWRGWHNKIVSQKNGRGDLIAYWGRCGKTWSMHSGW